MEHNKKALVEYTELRNLLIKSVAKDISIT